MTYAVLSDLHCHSWSLFAKTGSDGVNGRLRIILNEAKRAAKELLKAGGKVMVIAGDVFHVRGSIDPEVLNPTQSVIAEILDMGITIYAIPGNHDLKSKDTTELGSAIQTLAQTSSTKGKFIVVNEPQLIHTDDDKYFGFVPWRASIDDLVRDLGQIAHASGALDETDVFIHAGIDGILPGVADHGLSDARLAKFGFRHVFAGHYHNHKVMQGGVISIGATTHQTWGDIDSKAGFLLVDDNGGVRFMDTHAPKFIDVSGRDEDEIKLLCDGNYIRFRGAQMTSEDLQELKTFFETHGALGTSIQVPPAQTATRQASAPVKSGQSLGQSVASYVDKAELPQHIDREEVKRQAADVLKTSQAVYEEA